MARLSTLRPFVVEPWKRIRKDPHKITGRPRKIAMGSRMIAMGGRDPRCRDPRGGEATDATMGGGQERGNVAEWWMDERSIV